MPCSDGGPTEDEERRNRERTSRRMNEQARLAQNYVESKKKLDKLTDLLCKAGRARKNKTNIPQADLTWWDDHYKLDAERGEPW